MKLASLTATGGEAKSLIQDGQVLVNGEICRQRGRQEARLPEADQLPVTAGAVGLAGGQADHGLQQVGLALGIFCSTRSFSVRRICS